MSDRSSDEELVARAQTGDKRAFDLLVLKYQQKVAGLIGRYLRDPNEVLDVTQEAFIKAYRALGGFRGESAFYTWLYRIAINAAKIFQHLKRQSKTIELRDILIAATAMVNSLPIVTLNRKHYERIEGLQLM